MKRFYFVTVISFLATILNAQTDVNFEWAKSFGGIQSDFSNSIAIDDSGNVYTAGSFGDTVDFNPGLGIYNLMSEGGSNAFIQKLDSLGNFVWAKAISGRVYISSIVIDVLGNTIATGCFRDSVDFNPDTGISILKSNGLKDYFILKLNTLGNLVWAKSFGGISSDNSFSVVTDISGNVYTTGYFQNTIDFDPGIDTFNLTNGGAFIHKLDKFGDFVWAKSIEGSFGKSLSIDNMENLYISGIFQGKQDFNPEVDTFYLTSNSGNGDVFTLKLDVFGNFKWANSIKGLGFDTGNSIDNDVYGNVYTIGKFRNIVDFDPGIDTFNLESETSYDIFLQKLDTSGSFVWAIAIHTELPDTLCSISVDDFGNIYTTGGFAGTVDFNPGPGISNLTSEGGDVFILKLDALGNFVWAKSISGSGSGMGRSIISDNIGNVYSTGFYYGALDFDPTSSSYNLTNNQHDIYILKWSKDSCSDLALVIDSISDVTCNNSGFASAYILNGFTPFIYSWNTNPIGNDSFAILNIPGIFELSISDSIGCTRSTSLIIKGPSDTLNFDLNANLVSANFRPGFSSTINLNAFNDGCVPISGELSLVLNQLVIFESALPPPDLINGDSLIWNFSNLTYDSTYMQPEISLTTRTSASIGDIVCFDLFISPAIGDADSTNNIKQYCFDIINSYDPNDKQVYPKCDSSYITNDQILTYTIRFQNTGNAEAINIFILDSLDPNLDINTVRIIGKSHEPLITEVLPENVLKFRFDNILLPDSTNNEPESHGYIIFEVHPIPTLPAGTVIENKSGIYFDYNEPIITNTVLSTITDVVQECYKDIDYCSDITIITDTVADITDTNFGLSSVHAMNGRPPYNYNWNTNQIINDSIAYFDTAGIYQITVNDAIGCLRSASIEIFDLSTPIDTSITDTITNMLINTFTDNINVYPNPNSGNITIELGNIYNNVSIELYNITGLLLEQKVFSKANTINMNINAPKGMYYISIISEKNEKTTFKIIKE